MRYRTLGDCGVSVSEIGVGAYPMSGFQDKNGTRVGWTGSSDMQSIDLIHRAQDLGVNLIDTAEAYGDGHSEEVVGRALQGRRDHWLIATKVTPNKGLNPDAPDLPRQARQRIIDSAEASLRRLRTDVIDLYQLHAVPLAGAEEATMQALGELRDAGKVRFAGISTNDLAAIERLAAHGPVQILQVGYNLLEPAGGKVLDWAARNGAGTLIRVPLAKGMLSGRYFDNPRIPEGDVRHERFSRPETVSAFGRLRQLRFLAGPGRSLPQAALRFTLQHPGTHCVIAGAKTVQQIEENAAACLVAEVAAPELDQVRSITAGLVIPNWSANP